MSHFMKFYNTKYVGAWDLPPDRDVTVTIDKVRGEEIVGANNKKDRKAVVYLRGKQKPLVLCKTNAKTIAKLYGVDTRQWVGKPIAIFVALVEAFGDTVQAIRVRPRVPDMPAPPPEPKQLPSVADAELVDDHEEEEGAFDHERAAG